MIQTGGVVSGALGPSGESSAGPRDYDLSPEPEPAGQPRVTSCVR
jgi:hypothetical protein